MRRVVLNKNIDKRKYYSALVYLDILMEEYNRYKNAMINGPTERIRKKHEQLSKEYYENTLEPYLSQQADRFNISSEEMIADIKNINNYI